MISYRNKKTRTLNKSGRNLIRFPDCVFEDTNIRRLNLSNNNIEDIPRDIVKMKNLRMLNLENNNIKELHNGISLLPSLRVLNLKGNPISRVPGFMRKRKVKVLIDPVQPWIDHLFQVADTGVLNEIHQEINEIISHKTKFEETKVVPLLENLTFSRNKDRTGKTLKSCVLFVDIRDSVSKNEELASQRLANMYFAFIYGVLKCAINYNGHVRNIIGDRVMIVFDEENSCDNALKCANSILGFTYRSMRDVVGKEQFDCGIGVHYGKMNIIKVGFTRHNDENIEYQNLVWMGEPANLSSRLTDIAGKGNLPKILISENVYAHVNNRDLVKHFVLIPKTSFIDVDFKVYGIN